MATVLITFKLDKSIPHNNSTRNNIQDLCSNFVSARFFLESCSGINFDTCGTNLNKSADVSIFV